MTNAPNPSLDLEALLRAFANVVVDYHNGQAMEAELDEARAAVLAAFGEVRDATIEECAKAIDKFARDTADKWADKGEDMANSAAATAWDYSQCACVLRAMKDRAGGVS